MKLSSVNINKYNKEFDEWYCDNQISDTIYEILFVQRTRERQVDLITQLLYRAYSKGLQVAAQDSIDALRNFATITTGLPTVAKTPDQTYSQVASELMVHLTKALDNFEKARHGNSHS